MIGTPHPTVYFAFHSIHYPVYYTDIIQINCVIIVCSEMRDLKLEQIFQKPFVQAIIIQKSGLLLFFTASVSLC